MISSPVGQEGHCFLVVKFFDPDSECFAKYDAFCLHIFDYACLIKT